MKNKEIILSKDELAIIEKKIKPKNIKKTYNSYNSAFMILSGNINQVVKKIGDSFKEASEKLKVPISELESYCTW